MRGGRSVQGVAIAGVMFAVVSCTSATEDGTPAPTATASPAPTAEPSPTPSAMLASGEPLPDGCDVARVKPGQTVTFVADGRAWAIDPTGRRLTCLFDVTEPEPFAWGPLGDRVLLGGLEVRGLAPTAPAFPALDAEPGAFDWGHPLGLAVVYAEEGARVPEKRYLDDGHVARLRQMPKGEYLDIAYHPSGLALGVAIEQQGEESIWLTTNEGTAPERLVFSEGGTRFPSVAFTPNGERLVWIAQHLNTYQVHWMDLADRTGFDDGWRGELDEEATNLHVGLDGELMALDVGTGCEDRIATGVLSPTVARPLLPDEDRPTTVLGWLDDTTVLVGAGGCDDAIDLSAVDVLERTVAELVIGAEVGASRAEAPPGPDEVPEPPEAAPPPPPEGVG